MIKTGSKCVLKIKMTFEKIIAYHYMPYESFEVLKTKDFYKAGLLPGAEYSSVIRSGFDIFLEGLGLLELRKALYCFLEREPESWIKNKDFPFVWKDLIEYLQRGTTQHLMLLSFPVLPTDKAFVVERAHRQAYIKQYGNSPHHLDKLKDSYVKYWKSKVPVFNYDNSYSLPELIFLSPVGAERLHQEWDLPKKFCLEKNKWLPTTNIDRLLEEPNTWVGWGSYKYT